MGSSFSEALEALMTERDLSGYALARRVPCDRGLISRYVNAKQEPSLRMAQRLDEALRADGKLLALAQIDRHTGRLGAESPVVADLAGAGTDAVAVSRKAELIDVNRRELLRTLSMTGAALAICPAADNLDWEQLDNFAGRHATPDADALEGLAALNEHLWRVFVLSRSKNALLPFVRDQLDVLTDGFRRAGSAASYHHLCELASSLYQLAGEILFDSNQYTDAAQCYTLAATAAREAEMPDLWACALTRHAFIGVYEQEFGKAAPMLELATAIAQRGDSALATRHWVAIVEAQALAGLGDLGACQRALDAASQVDSLGEGSQNGGWLRFDASRLAEERAACYVRLQRPDLADSALADALRLSLSARRRASVLADLAAIGAQRGELDQVVAHADAAIELFQQTGSGVVARKLSGLQRYLAPLLNDTTIRDLSSRIAAISESSVAV